MKMYIIFNLRGASFNYYNFFPVGFLSPLLSSKTYELQLVRNMFRAILTRNTELTCQTLASHMPKKCIVCKTRTVSFFYKVQEYYTTLYYVFMSRRN